MATVLTIEIDTSHMRRLVSVFEGCGARESFVLKWLDSCAMGLHETGRVFKSEGLKLSFTRRFHAVCLASGLLQKAGLR